MSYRTNYNTAKRLVENYDARQDDAQVYALLAIADELKAVRELLEKRSRAVILDGTN